MTTNGTSICFQQTGTHQLGTANMVAFAELKRQSSLLVASATCTEVLDFAEFISGPLNWEYNFYLQCQISEQDKMSDLK